MTSARGCCPENKLAWGVAGTLVPGSDAGAIAARGSEERALEGAGPVEAAGEAEGSSGAIYELEAPAFTVAS